MSEYHEIIEADKEYLEKAGMRQILQEFVADAMEEHPKDVYEYMAAWATEKAASQRAARYAATEELDEAYPVEGSPNGAAHSNDELTRPDPSLRRHEEAFDIGHPAHEQSKNVKDTPEPEVSSKVIEEVANAIEDEEEL